MNPVRTPTLSSLGLLALVVPRPFVGPVAFAPQEGSTLTKRFELVSVTRIDSMDMTVNGEPAAFTPELDATTTETRVVVVKDTYVSNRDGAPEELERHFAELSRVVESPVEMDMMGQSVSADMHATGTSELAGKTVVFTWDEDSDGYERAFGAEGGDVALLAELVEDMDLRLLLPGKEVKQGDRWDIDVGALVDLFYSGGNLGFEMESDGDDPPQGFPDPANEPDAREVFGDPEGEGTATLEGLREVDGKKLAVVRIELDVHFDNDVTDVYAESLERASIEGMSMTLESAQMTWSFEGGGELLWDVEGGHVASLEIKGDVSVEIDQTIGFEMAESMTIEQRVELSGTTTLSVTTD